MAHLYQRGKVWYGRARRGGKEHKRSFGTTNKALAEQAFRRWLDDLDAARLGLQSPKTIAELAVDFGRDYLPTLSKAGAERYRVSFRVLLPALGGLRLDELTPATMKEYVKARKASRSRSTGQPVTAQTIQRDFSALSSLWDYAIREGFAQANLVRDFMRAEKRYSLKGGKPREVVLTPEHEARILARLYQEAAWKGDAVVFSLETGLRWREQFGLRWGGVHPAIGAHGELRVVGKGNKARRVPLTERARQIVDRLPQHPTDDTMFLAPGGGRADRQCADAFRAACRALGYSYRWHDLRRTCGTRLRQRGMKLEDVAMWLGHASVQTTERAYAFLHADRLHGALAEIAPAAGPGANVVPLKRG